MINAGTLEVEVFELSYRQQYKDAGFYWGYNFCGGAVEPVLGGAGYLNSSQCLQALSLEDYGYMFLGDRVINWGAVQYNGQQFSQQSAADGQATGSLSDASRSTMAFSLYNLLPYGYTAHGNQAFSGAASFLHYANRDGDNGHLDASLAIGPCPFDFDFTAIDGSIHPSDFCMPYVMYDYFQSYLMCAEIGYEVTDTGLAFPDIPDQPVNDMMSIKTNVNAGYEGFLAGATNELGTYLPATTYLPPTFIPWTNWKARAQVDISDAKADETVSDLPAEIPLQSMFANGAYLQNARDFYILKGGQIFDGQPETPVLYNPVTNAYQPIKLLPQTAAAAQLVSQPSGLQLAYSKLQNCFYFIGSPPDYPQYIFGSNFTYPYRTPVLETPPGLVLSLPRFGVVPKLKMPCYGVRAPQPKLRR